MDIAAVDPRSRIIDLKHGKQRGRAQSLENLDLLGPRDQINLSSAIVRITSGREKKVAELEADSGSMVLFAPVQQNFPRRNCGLDFSGPLAGATASAVA